MNRHFAGLLLGVIACLVGGNSADAGHKVRYFYYPAPAYYAAPQVYYAQPVYAVPAPVVVHRPVVVPGAVYYAPSYCPLPILGRRRPAVVYSYPGYYGRGYRPYKELEIKYRWTRRGLRVKYDYDD